jgi:hypothetical protein
VSCRHHYDGSPRGPLGSPDRPPAIRPLDPVHLHPEPDPEAVMPRVGLQVPGHAVTRNPTPLGTRDGQAGQSREPPDRVQMEAVIVPPPPIPDLRRPLQEESLNPTRLEHGPSREPGRTGPDHDRLVTIGRHQPQ